MRMLALLCMSFWSMAAVGLGDEAGNGMGVAEKYLVYAYENLEKYIDLSMASNSSKLTLKERALLSQIRYSLEEERKTEKQLKFISNRKHKEEHNVDFFVIDNLIRIAKTGDNVGDYIYINTDLLYRPSAHGPLPISFLDAVGVLIHELGHHHGVKDHAALDHLSSKIQIMLKAHTQEISVSPSKQHRHVVAIAINFEGGWNPFTQLLVSDDKQIIDYSEKLKQQLSCPGPSQGKMVSLKVWNLHWMREKWVQAEKGRNRHGLRARLLIQCQRANNSISRHQDQDLVLDLGFDRDKHWRLVLAPDTEKIRQINCSQPNVTDCH